MLSFEELCAAETVALLPVGCMEQHGPSLPLETDSLLAEGCARRLAPRLPFPTYQYPGIHYTTTVPNQDFPGTVSVDYDVFRTYLRQVVQGLLAGGFRAVVILNSHGSVVGPIREVAFDLVHAQFRGSTRPVRPVIALNVFDCDHLVEAAFGLRPGRHADWKETLLVYGLVGDAYFTPERRERLEALAREGPTPERLPAVLGIPMQARSRRGVVGPVLPPESDWQAQADRLWELTLDYLRETLGETLEEFEEQYAQLELGMPLPRPGM